MYFYATDKRCKELTQKLLKISPNAKWRSIKTIKFVSGGISGNKKLMGSYLKQFYNKFIQKQDNLKEILKNVYTEFIISLRNYNNEMNDFVKYVSHLDILVTKAYISRKYNYCKTGNFG